ncbi:MAG: barstar family protein [Candidatus Saccharimonadota bacterium]|jgi:RNAse (barnase) inhibitor barstar
MNKSHIINLDLSKVKNWTSFHNLFKNELGFPKYYGANMNAWIDCMGDIHEGTDMTNLNLPYDTALVLRFSNSRFFRLKHPRIYYTLKDCTAFVNKHHIEHDHPGAAPIYLEFQP